MKDNAAPTKPATDKKSLTETLHVAIQSALRYSVVLFLLLLVAVYGFVAFKVYQAGAAEPTQDAINAGTQQTATPHIDPKVVSQMEGLQDRSVNVKTLFDQARSNPFGE